MKCRLHCILSVQSYFNLYTFVMFLAWIGVAVISVFRVELIEDAEWPASGNLSLANATDSQRFLGRMTVDTYLVKRIYQAMLNKDMKDGHLFAKIITDGRL